MTCKYLHSFQKLNVNKMCGCTFVPCVCNLLKSQETKITRPIDLTDSQEKI